MRAISALAAGVLGLAVFGVPGYAQSSPPVGDDSVRPFHISIPEEQLVELRQRIAATRWPDKETCSLEGSSRLASSVAGRYCLGTDRAPERPGLPRSGCRRWAGGRAAPHPRAPGGARFGFRSPGTCG